MQHNISIKHVSTEKHKVLSDFLVDVYVGLVFYFFLKESFQPVNNSPVYKILPTISLV